MKKILLISLNVLLYLNLFGQNNQISLNSGYTNQSFYSMQNGEVLNVSNQDWDIAFSTDNFSSSIRTNDGKGVELYTYHLGDISSWNNISSNDINNLSELMFNTDTSWGYGAFDINQTGGLDYGWGVYNMQTHHVVGDSLFLIKTINQNWKKLWIESKISGEYQIKYADLDGSNEMNMSIPALNYSDKNFIYYSLDNDQLIDREPNKNDWDITFTKYMTLYPFQAGFTPYSVTGTLHNAGVEVAQVDNISSPLTYSDYSLHSFSTTINTIGYDWKEFQGSYVIVDDRCYFLRDKSGNIWRLTFINFDGTSTGNIEFNTELIQSTDVNDLNSITSFAIYPNPATKNEELTLIYDLSTDNSKVTVRIYDVSGRERYVSELNNHGLMSRTINIEGFNPGIYMISINADGMQKTERIVIN
tara:strand:- start:28943 stop:30190 length:1248 start_codon:yes stop_codon:yes gene_type:complete